MCSFFLLDYNKIRILEVSPTTLLKIHSHPQINPPPSQAVRHRKLLRPNGFDPGITRLVGHLH
jgi:hypothetical protein